MPGTTQYFITHGPTALSDTLRFTDSGTVRVTPTSVEISGKRRAMSQRQYTFLIWAKSVFSVVFLLTLGMVIDVDFDISPLLRIAFIVQLGIALLSRRYTPREQTLTIAREEITDVSAAGEEVSFQVRQKMGRPILGVLTASTPYNAAILAQALRDGVTADTVFIVNFSSKVVRGATGQRGRILITPDRVELAGYFSPGKARPIPLIPGMRYKPWHLWALAGIAVTPIFVLLILPRSLMPSMTSPLFIVPLFSVTTMTIVALVVSVILTRARRLSTACFSKYAVTDLQHNGRDIRFSAYLADEDDPPLESFTLCADTDAQAVEILRTLTTFDASGQFPVRYGESATLSTMRLAGTGKLAVTPDTVTLTGRLEPARWRVLLWTVGGVSLVTYLIGMIVEHGESLLIVSLTFLAVHVLLWLALFAFPRRQHFSRAITIIAQSGRQLTITAGDQRALVHTCTVAEATEIAQVLGK